MNTFKNVRPSEVKKGDIVLVYGFQAKVIGVKVFGGDYTGATDEKPIYKIYLTYVSGNKEHFNYLRSQHKNGTRICKYVSDLQGNDNLTISILNQ